MSVSYKMVVDDDRCITSKRALRAILYTSFTNKRLGMDNTIKLAEQFAQDYALHKHVFATAESCTGGLISASITAVSGSSAWFDRSFITYTNKSKMDMLGVSEEALGSYGAVSEIVACMMVKGALKGSDADIAVAVTGIAGPTGGSQEKPVGTVYIAFKRRCDEHCFVKRHLFDGDREQVRHSTVCEALNCLLTLSASKSLQEAGYSIVS